MSGGIFKQLRAYLPPAEYAVFSEVRNATGFKGERSADAVAMSLWPSRGLEVIGYEFKVSRSDWLRELKDPAKAEPIAKFCDRWFIVAPKDVVKVDELPRTWGLLVSGEKGLRQSVAAPLLTPQPLTREFVAALHRRAQEAATAPLEHLRAEIRTEEYQKVVADHNARATSDQRRGTHDYDNLSKLVAQFEQASGIEIRHGWNRERAGRAVRLILDGGADLASQTEDAARRLAQLVETAKATAAELRAMQVTQTEPA